MQKVLASGVQKMLLNLNNLSQGCRLVRNSMNRLQRQGVIGKNIFAGVRPPSCPKISDSRVKLSLMLFSGASPRRLNPRQASRSRAEATPSVCVARHPPCTICETSTPHNPFCRCVALRGGLVLFVADWRAHRCSSWLQRMSLDPDTLPTWRAFIQSKLSLRIRARGHDARNAPASRLVALEAVLFGSFRKYEWYQPELSDTL